MVRTSNFAARPIHGTRSQPQENRADTPGTKRSAPTCAPSVSTCSQLRSKRTAPGPASAECIFALTRGASERSAEDFASYVDTVLVLSNRPPGLKALGLISASTRQPPVTHSRRQTSRAGAAADTHDGASLARVARV